MISRAASMVGQSFLKRFSAALIKGKRQCFKENGFQDLGPE